MGNPKTCHSVLEKDEGVIANDVDTGLNLDNSLLEITVVYIFLKKSDLNSKDAIVLLKKLKPLYAHEKIVVGISRTKQLFPPSEKEIADMKKEFADVESASISDMRL